jgi:hypothetical protein
MLSKGGLYLMLKQSRRLPQLPTLCRTDFPVFLLLMFLLLLLLLQLQLLVGLQEYVTTGAGV